MCSLSVRVQLLVVSAIIATVASLPYNLGDVISHPLELISEPIFSTKPEESAHDDNGGDFWERWIAKIFSHILVARRLHFLPVCRENRLRISYQGVCCLKCYRYTVTVVWESPNNSQQ